MENKTEQTKTKYKPDKYEKTILVALAIQKEGQATLEEIKEKVDELIKKDNLDLRTTEQQIARECKKLQKKDLISTNYIKIDGMNVLAYSPSKSLFNRGIESMQFKDIVDAEKGDFVKKLDAKKGASKGKMPDIRDYYNVKVKWEVTDLVGCLGFMPQHKEGYLEHYRDSKGNVIFLPKHFRAYIRANLRKANKTNVHNYMVFDYGWITLNGNKLQKTEHFVIDQMQGKGSVRHEVIPTGSAIETTFGVPGKSGFTPEEFQEFLTEIAVRPIRGLSGASSQGFGKLKLVEFEVLK